MHWHIARGPNDQGPCAYRCPLVTTSSRPEARQHLGYKGADLLIGEPIGLKRVIADRGYDANRIRAALRDQGTIPVIPGRRKPPARDSV